MFVEVTDDRFHQRFELRPRAVFGGDDGTDLLVELLRGRSSKAWNSSSLSWK